MDYPKEVIQDGKRFVKSEYREGVYLWMNRPIHSKSFDYYMCTGCGRIISNCGFSNKHKCIKYNPNFKPHNT